jgi:NAD-dependent SIR2 family protein deacetylase
VGNRASRRLRHAQALRVFIDRYSRLFVLTGARCSTASDIPDYRDAKGDWKRVRPVMWQRFRWFADLEALVAPDGDADLNGIDFAKFRRAGMRSMRRSPQA